MSFHINIPKSLFTSYYIFVQEVIFSGLNVAKVWRKMCVLGIANHVSDARTGESGIAQDVTDANMGKMYHVKSASQSSMKSTFARILPSNANQP